MRMNELTDVTVSDIGTPGGPVAVTSCSVQSGGKGPGTSEANSQLVLEPGDVATCTASGTALPAGTYANTATVEGIDLVGTMASANASNGYQVDQPSGQGPGTSTSESPANVGIGVTG